MRALKPDEIEVRVGTVGHGKNGGYASMLLYKNARVDRQILDETFGPFGWQNRYNEHKGNLFCSIGVYDPSKKEWIWKEDCGTESNTEKEKGEASDAFKRAGFRWGIGIELYSSPKIYLDAAVVPDERIRGKYKLNDARELSGIKVHEIITKNGKIEKLSLVQDKTIIWSTEKREKGLKI